MVFSREKKMKRKKTNRKSGQNKKRKFEEEEYIYVSRIEELKQELKRFEEQYNNKLISHDYYENGIRILTNDIDYDLSTIDMLYKFADSHWGSRIDIHPVTDNSRSDNVTRFKLLIKHSIIFEFDSSTLQHKYYVKTKKSNDMNMIVVQVLTDNELTKLFRKYVIYEKNNIAGTTSKLKFNDLISENCRCSDEELLKYWKKYPIKHELSISSPIVKDNDIIKRPIDLTSPKVLIEQSIIDELAQKYKGRKEVIIPNGRIDVVTDDTIIEVKDFENRTDAIGQILMYAQDEHFKDKKKVICIFNHDSSNNNDKKESFDKLCTNLGIKVMYYSSQVTIKIEDTK